VDYLQRDAAAKGALSNPPKKFGSFWNNLDTIMENKGKVFIANNSRGKMVGFMVLARDLILDDEEGFSFGGTLSLEIFEVLPRYRNKGFGKEMLEWLKTKAAATGFNRIKVTPANSSENFWKRLGFSEYPGDGLMLCIA